jgi:hypothetical protein
LDSPHVSKKPDSQQRAPKAPNFDKEREKTIEYEGLPPLEAPTKTAGTVVFRNVSSVWRKDDAGSIRSTHASTNNVVVKGGIVMWSGPDAELTMYDDALVVDLQGGSISPALVSIGSQLGLEEIEAESSTSDGVVFDPLDMKIPALLGEKTLIRAVDGLQFGTRNALCVQDHRIYPRIAENLLITVWLTALV